MPPQRIAQRISVPGIGNDFSVRNVALTAEQGARTSLQNFELPVRHFFKNRINDYLSVLVYGGKLLLSQ